MADKFLSASGICRVVKNADGSPAIDKSRRLVLGWLMASKVRKADGTEEEYFDLQGDNVTDEDLLDLVLEFAKGQRESDDMHDEERAGWFPLIGTTVVVGGVDFAKSFGWEAPPVRGIFAVFQADDNERGLAVFEKFVDGTYTGFSFGGFGIREEIKEAA